MTARRALDLRHTAPMVRVGTGFAKGLMVTPRAAAVGAAAREFRQQRDADAGRHHLPQRLEAGGAEILLLVHVGARADVERLVAQAMAVFEQQQRFVAQVIRP